jgi:hypothetical protein
MALYPVQQKVPFLGLALNREVLCFKGEWIVQAIQRLPFTSQVKLVGRVMENMREDLKHHNQAHFVLQKIRFNKQQAFFYSKIKFIKHSYAIDPQLKRR